MSDEEAIGTAIACGIRVAMAPAIAKITALEQKVAALEARPTVKDHGVWEAGEVYPEGAVVSHQGSAWICRSMHMATGAEPDHVHFRLLVKHGRDAGRYAR